MVTEVVVEPAKILMGIKFVMDTADASANLTLIESIQVA
jgi:hypothetical protein